jgi:hypothetical protein
LLYTSDDWKMPQDTCLIDEKHSLRGIRSTAARFGRSFGKKGLRQKVKACIFPHLMGKLARFFSGLALFSRLSVGTRIARSLAAISL